MPVLTNARHERFAQALAKGQPAGAAYVAAGYSPNEGNASRLKGNEKIGARVAELQAPAAEKVEITLESLMRDLQEARELALSLGQASAAVAATKEMGVLSGLRVEKRETTNKRDPKAMSDAELADIAAQPIGERPTPSGAKTGVYTH